MLVYVFLEFWMVCHSWFSFCLSISVIREFSTTTEFWWNMTEYFWAILAFIGLCPFYSHKNMRSFLLGDISWSKVPVTICDIASQTKEQPGALAQMGLAPPRMVLFHTAALHAGLSQGGALLPHRLPCLRQGCCCSFSAEWEKGGLSKQVLQGT